MEDGDPGAHQGTADALFRTAPADPFAFRQDAEDLVSLSVYIAGDLDIGPAFGAWMAFWANRGAPPIIKVLRVAGLGNPDFLIEIEAQAAIA
ncbi:hypothetical protein NKH09_16030 [Mesorhizobium sp. M1339]